MTTLTTPAQIRYGIDVGLKAMMGHGVFSVMHQNLKTYADARVVQHLIAKCGKNRLFCGMPPNDDDDDDNVVWSLKKTDLPLEWQTKDI